MDVTFSYVIGHLSMSLFENYSILTNDVQEENKTDIQFKMLAPESE